MIDQHAALKGAQEVIGSEKIEDVAIAFPVGTLRAQSGATAGGDAAGLALSLLSGTQMANSVVGGGAIGGFVAQKHLEKIEPAASIVLALTATSLYLLGRKKLGIFASFKDLSIIAQIPRNHFNVEVEPNGITKRLTITDEENNQVFTYEVKPFGSGLKQFLSDVRAE